ncbi:MAG: hypothetical protein ACE5NG_01200 [bacterium]
MNHNRLNISPPRGKVAASTQNQALSAIVFLYPVGLLSNGIYREVLKKDIDDFSDGMIWAKKLPEVFTREEALKIKRVVKPGQPGTKKLTERYGDNMICVRYRYDAENKRVLKTIELIIENMPWQPHSERIPKNKIVNLRVAANEIELRKRVKAAGGKWHPGKQVWQLAYKDILNLGLKERIVD